MSVPLRSIPDHEILSRTQALASQERKITLSLLLHLNEVERRQLFLKRGYSSMFVYCTSHLRLSEPAAARRIRTARCLARFPELYQLLESGDVSLSTVSMVSKYLAASNAADILARIRGRSRREVERVVAELEPRAALPPDRVRTVVVPVTPATRASAPRFTVAGDSEKSPGLMTKPGDLQSPDPHERSPEPTASSSQLERRALVQFTACENVVTKLDRVRSLAAHRLRGNVSLEAVIELVVDYFIEREDPAARCERRRRRATGTRVPRGENTARRIPADVRDHVFVRDNRRCTYIATDGRRCESTHVLQIDHIQPVARGGAATPGNLRLLCAKHNRLEAERLLGVGCCTPVADDCGALAQ